jgi:hypothetical protein
MLAVLFVSLAAAGFAQTGQDALPLLREVADASRGLTSYRADGHIAQDIDQLGGTKLELDFHIASRLPQQLRIEVTGGLGGLRMKSCWSSIRSCWARESASLWREHRHAHSSSSARKQCRPALSAVFTRSPGL